VFYFDRTIVNIVKKLESLKHRLCIY